MDKGSPDANVARNGVPRGTVPPGLKAVEIALLVLFPRIVRLTGSPAASAAAPLPEPPLDLMREVETRFARRRVGTQLTAKGAHQPVGQAEADFEAVDFGVVRELLRQHLTPRFCRVTRCLGIGPILLQSIGFIAKVARQRAGAQHKDVVVGR
eukprot:scaffold8634_cov115-Isochrysis_galbana.AAC.13